MYHAFVATVPFTLLEAIHFVTAYGLEEADVYITKTFSGAEDTAVRLRETGLFRNVYLEEDVLLTYPITVKKCFNTVRNGHDLVKKLSKRHYDYAYYNNSGWLVNSVFYTGFIKGNPECKHRFIEHSFSTYLTPYGMKPWYLRPLIQLTGFRCMDGTMLEALYVFDPDLIKVHQDGEIRIMPQMDRTNKRFIDALNHTFSFDPANNEFADKQIFIMEQGPLKAEIDMEAFWSSILPLLDHKKTIIKPHPRQKQSALQSRGIDISKSQGIPWEVIALNTNMEEKTQITIFSGSCITPKVSSGVESRVILLYKLLPVDYSFFGEKIVDLSQEIGAKFEDSDKFFVPESFEEMQSYCKKHGLTD